ncbi:MAG: hypothetical protein PUE85_07115 [Firmicutes bacterium]|nr:hypothetical protein [Bacillota bacterium]
MRFERTNVYNFEGALRGMRNPLDSWDKSDSGINAAGEYEIGPADLALAQRLISGGTEHRKFMRQIFVTVDITAPIYWWSEYDTYKVGTTANSRSTMHTLSKYPITEEMFERDPDSEYGAYWDAVIPMLEELRLKYRETGDYKYFRLLKQRLPSSFLQMRTCTMNYENVRSIVGQRRNHRLIEWSRDFIKWAEGLPYSKELIFFEKGRENES